jgi:hypothetical protein
MAPEIDGVRVEKMDIPQSNQKRRKIHQRKMAARSHCAVKSVQGFDVRLFAEADQRGDVIGNKATVLIHRHWLGQIANS